MFMKKFTYSVIAIPAAIFLMGAAPPPPPDPATVTLETTKLAPGVAVIFGAGGNIGVSYGPDGSVLIDDQFSSLTPKITAAVEALNARPIRFVVNTHWHFDHAGGNENFGKAGAVIVAHDNVHTRMSSDQVIEALDYEFPPSPKEALPIISFAEGMTFHLNNDVLQVVHAAAAHTDGDAFVKWEKANVLHTGDVFNRSGPPFIDRSSGGSAVGMIAAMDTAIALTDGNTKVIPGHGPMGTRADMVAYRDALKNTLERVSAEYEAGKSLVQLLEMKLQWEAAAAGPASADRLVQAIYVELKTAGK
jgi:cyclase